MSNGTHTETGSGGLAELSSDWLRDLRSQLGRKRKRGRIGRLKLGLQRSEKSRTADRFRTHYKQSRQRIENLKLLGEDVAGHERAFNSLVERSRAVMERPVDKSGAEESRKEEFRKLDEEFQTLASQLKDLEKRLRSEKKQLQWSSSEDKCRGRLVEYTGAWSTPETATVYRQKFDRLVKAVAAIPQDQRQAQRQDVEQQYNLLREEIEGRIADAKAARRDYEQGVAAIRKDIKTLSQLAPESDIARPESYLERVRDAARRHDYAAANKKVFAARALIGDLVKQAGAEKRRYEANLGPAQAALGQYRDATPPQARLIDAAEKLAAAVRLSKALDYARAADQLADLTQEFAEARKALGTSVAAWNGPWRSELDRQIKTVQSRFPDAFIGPLLKELNGRLETAEFLAKQTGDLQTAWDSVQRLRAWFDERLKTIELAAGDSEGPAVKEQQAYATRYAAVEQQLAQVDKKLKSKSKLLHDRLEATRITDFSRVVNEKDFAAAFADGTRLLAKLETELDAILSNAQGEFEALRDRESEEARRIEQSASHAAVLKECQDLLARVQAAGDPADESAKRIAGWSDARGQDSNALRGLVASLTNERDELQDRLTEITREGGELEQARGALENGYKDFGKQYARHHKRVGGGELNDVYEALKKQADSLYHFVSESGNMSLLQDANAQLVELRLRIEDLGRSGKDVGALKSNIKQFNKLLDQVKGHKPLKTLFADERTQLLAELDGARATVYGGGPLDQAGRLLVVLAGQVKTAVADADKAASVYQSMKSSLAEVAGYLNYFRDMTEAEISDTSYHERYAELKQVLDRKSPFGIISAEPKSRQLLRDIQALAGADLERFSQAAETLRRDQRQRQGERAAENERNERRFEEWNGALNKLRDTDWQRAKESVAGDEHGNKEAIRLIRDQIHEAEKLGKKYQFDAAWTRLEVIRAQCKKLIQNPRGGSISGSLGKLQGAWGPAVATLADAVRNLQQEIRKGDEADWKPFEKLLAALPEPVWSFEPADAFEDSIRTLSDGKSESRSRLKARETGLAHVQAFSRRLQDPLLQAMGQNQFGVSMPLGAVYHTLSDLDYNLQTSS